MRMWMILLILCVLFWMLGVISCDLFLYKRNTAKAKREMEIFRKQYQYYHLLNYWMYIKQRNITLEGWFKKKGFKKIAIYGMKELGERLYDELIDTDIEISCVVDQNKKGVLASYEVLDLNDEIPQVDVVIVTSYYYFDEILRSLKPKVSCPILPLEYVIQDAHNQ